MCRSHFWVRRRASPTTRCRWFPVCHSLFQTNPMTTYNITCQVRPPVPSSCTSRHAPGTTAAKTAMCLQDGALAVQARHQKLPSACGGRDDSESWSTQHSCVSTQLTAMYTELPVSGTQLWQQALQIFQIQTETSAPAE